MVLSTEGAMATAPSNRLVTPRHYSPANNPLQGQNGPPASGGRPHGPDQPAIPRVDLEPPRRLSDGTFSMPAQDEGACGPPARGDLCPPAPLDRPKRGCHKIRCRCPRRLVAVARRVEELGSDNVWVLACSFPVAPRAPYPVRRPKWMLNPIGTLVFAAAVTSRVGVGTGILNIPWCSPMAAGPASDYARHAA